MKTHQLLLQHNAKQISSMQQLIIQTGNQSKALDSLTICPSGFPG